jgi:predicted outer membrane protein
LRGALATNDPRVIPLRNARAAHDRLEVHAIDSSFARSRTSPARGLDLERRRGLMGPGRSRVPNERQFAMRIIPVLLFSAAVGTTIAAYPAQQNPQNPPGGQSNPPGQTQPGQRPDARDSTSIAGATSRMDDGILATWLLVENNNEIQLSQLALERASDPEVKQFAQKMVDDHREMGRKLQSFASAAGYVDTTGAADRSGAGAGNRPPEGRNASGGTDNAGGTDTSRPTPPPAGAARATGASGLDHVALLQELGNQCLQSARKELESKSGAEFDRCYTGMAIGAHMKVNDQLTVFQRHASADLRNAMAEGQKTVQMHLEHAKQLAKKLEGSTSTSGTNKK